ncbi:protein-disulfide isomerase [Geoanaerobacter pelophilus]|uniref:Protein-disulfide isomerase n=1 Tax=Geoanaerobacter pelophilus TaxID=60036 RepID=A0ABQ0MEU0_9BACT|nr:DsbC family protein [Geoanaerobacter pelophilus]GAW65613.1 protein-disulfide isomerase [Geoanaerobacter pelophilus]
MWFTRRFLAVFFSTAVLLLLAGVSFAAPVSPENAFRSAFPQVPFDNITPSEINGVYEVISGPNIFYYYPEKDLIITGEIVGKDLKSRTAERREVLSSQMAAKAAEAVKDLPLDKAVKVGDGKKKVIEFTDPDCPYCRKASEYFTKRSDVTRYVFFAPLAHPAAIKKIEYILSAENKAEAYDAMMMGEEIPPLAKPASEEVKKLAQEHLALARKVGIQGTPTFFVKGEQVIGADTKKLDELLK